MDSPSVVRSTRPHVLFLAFERRQRDESGFFTSNVARGLTGSATIPWSGTQSRCPHCFQYHARAGRLHKGLVTAAAQLFVLPEPMLLCLKRWFDSPPGFNPLSSPTTARRPAIAPSARRYWVTIHLVRHAPFQWELPTLPASSCISSALNLEKVFP